MKRFFQTSITIIFLIAAVQLFTNQAQAVVNPCSPDAPTPCQCFGVDGILAIANWPGGSVTITCAGNTSVPVPACRGGSNTLNIGAAASVSQAFTLQNCNCYTSNCISVTANPNPAPATACTVGTFASCGTNGQVITPSVGIDCPPPPEIPPLQATCKVNNSTTDATINSGGSVTWSVTTSGGPSTNYTYSWSGSDSLSSTSQSFSKTYTTSGTKTASVTVASGTDSIELSPTSPYGSCPTVTVNPCSATCPDYPTKCPHFSPYLLDSCGGTTCNGTKTCTGAGVICDTVDDVCRVPTSPYCSTQTGTTTYNVGSDPWTYTVNASISTNISPVSRTRWYVDNSEITPSDTYTSTSRSLSPITCQDTRHTLKTTLENSSGTVFDCGTSNMPSTLCSSSTGTGSTATCPTTAGSKSQGTACTATCECSTGLACRGDPQICNTATTVNCSNSIKPDNLDPPLNGVTVAPISSLCPWNTSPSTETDGTHIYWCWPPDGSSCSSGTGVALRFRVPDSFFCNGRKAHIWRCDSNGSNCSEADSTRDPSGDESKGPWQIRSDNYKSWEFISCDTSPGNHSWYVKVTCDNTAMSTCTSDTAYYMVCDNSCTAASTRVCGTSYTNGCGTTCPTGTLCDTDYTCSTAGSCVAVPPGSFSLSSAEPGCNTTFNMVTLVWTSSTHASSYEVYRGLPTGLGTRIGTVANNNSSTYTYVDPTGNSSGIIPPNDLTTYNYYVVAVNNAGSPTSNILPATTRKCGFDPWIQTVGGDVYAPAINTPGGP